MKTDAEVIAEVVALDAKASAGPWEANVWMNFDEGGWAAVGPHHQPGDTDEEREDNCEPESPTGNIAKRDADFIAASRTLLPDLAKRLTAANQEIAELRKELHDVRQVCTEALKALHDAQSVYKPREDTNYWRWETTGEGLAGIEWDVTTPLTKDQRAALSRIATEGK